MAGQSRHLTCTVAGQSRRISCTVAGLSGWDLELYSLMAQVGAAPKMQEFLKLVQYSHINHLTKYHVNVALSPLLCCNSAGKQG